MKTFAVILTSMLMAGLAPAIVVDDYSTATSAPTNEPSGNWDLNWDYIYNYKESSSVAVGEYWILTAAHVADDNKSGNLTIAGTTYFPQEIIFHSGSDDPDNADNADLALVRYDKPFPGFYDLYTGSFFTSSGFIMVGFGNTGTVVEGRGFFNPDYYTDSGSGRGTKRWGTQAVDRSVNNKSYDVQGLFTTNDMFEMDFDVGDTTYEAGVGVYDSGGGSFVKDNGVWKLAGINTIRGANQNGYISTFAVSIPAYETWITQTMANATNDDDSDGIPNDWEYEKSGSTVGVDASADQDDDDLTGLEEYQNSTDPLDPDSDDDFMPDGWELDNGFNPTNAVDGGLDFDNDTLVNSNEYLLGTDFANPDMDGDAVLDGWEFFGTSNTAYGSESTIITNADSDADGLPDGVEMGITNSNGFITNPNSADTDSDGIPDEWEVVNGISPVDGSDDTEDPDDDGFTSRQEYIADTDPTNSNSFLRVEGFTVSGHQTISFNGSAARQYQLLTTTNDLAATNLTWITNGVPVWGKGANTEITVTNTEEKVFYRLEAILP